MADPEDEDQYDDDEDEEDDREICIGCDMRIRPELGFCPNCRFGLSYGDPGYDSGW